MRMKNIYLPTLKETPAEAEVVSHKLMLRAGMMRKLSAGVYSYLPLGLRVIRKIEKIVREEMNKSEAQEVLLPVMQTADIWKESKRWERFGPLMVKFYDRKEHEYCLGPTHEEVVASLVRDEVRSYKDLPMNLYQIQTKFRDEIRPRFGVMRSREFIMKDAYSLDRDYEGLDKSYQTMYKTYVNVFKNCGLKTRVVEADTGAMGGKDSHEFMVLAESGEDEIALCTSCDYASNVERATAASEKNSEVEELKQLKSKKTPDMKTINALEDFLDTDASKMIKTLALKADGEPIIVLVRGDDQLNEIKLINYINAVELEAVAAEEFPEMFASVAGFIGPVGLKDCKILADNRIKDIRNGIAGANKKDYHYLNVNPGRDFEVDEYLDLRKVKKGDKCPHCGEEIDIKAGIEVGHIFKLGTKYSQGLNATYLDEKGKEQFIVMGSYGIGITRLVAAAIEQNNDKDGIIWPVAIAPYQVIILPLGNDNKVMGVANNLYEELQDKNIEVLIDDRKERAGVKFNDADLIGIPLRITIGSRSIKEGVVEVHVRRTGEEMKFTIEAAGGKIKELLGNIK